MVTPAEYLTKQLFIENSVVSYRTLSGSLSIGINVAKNELAAFYNHCKSESRQIHATYAICGRLRIPEADSSQLSSRDSEGTAVPVFTIAVVDEVELETSLKAFEEGTMAHFYSLSPSPITDPSLLTQDNTGTPKPPTVLQTIEKAVPGDKLKIGKNAELAQPSRTIQPLQKAHTFDSSAIKIESTTRGVKPLARANTYSNAEGEPTPAKSLATLDQPAPAVSTRQDTKFEPAPLGEQTGFKEPTTLTENQIPGTKHEGEVERVGVVRVHKGVLLSDDDEEYPPGPRVKGKKRKSTAFHVSDEDDANPDDADAQAMEVDSAPPVVSTEPHDPTDQDDCESDEAGASGFVDKKERKSRKNNKGIPIGKNGRAKKKVMRTKREKGKNGYMEDVDYSSWESDPGEPTSTSVAAPVKQTLGKAAKTGSKPTGSRKSLHGFFVAR